MVEKMKSFDEVVASHSAEAQQRGKELGQRLNLETLQDMLQHQQDVVAKLCAEIMIGADKIVRINIDGICILRINMREDNPILSIECLDEIVLHQINDWLKE